MARRFIRRISLDWSYNSLFDSNGFCEVARLVNIVTFGDGYIVGEKLGNDIEKNRSEEFKVRCNFYNILDGKVKLGGVGDDNNMTTTSKNFLDTGDRFLIEGVVRKED